ncbi:MAG: nucleoside-diphosphate kinase [Chloroflexota bacterium]
MEQTLVLIKPDGVQRGLVGVIIHRLERRGLRLAALKLLRVDEARARKLYEVHLGKRFYETLVSYICSSPVVALVWQGGGAIDIVRRTMGATDPAEAPPGTIRGDFGINIGRNLIHGSDSPESAAREVPIFFTPEEIVHYPRVLDPWYTEGEL